MTDKVQLIRAEIEKKIKVLSPFTLQGSDTCGKVIRQLESLVSFIDSLPEEPVSKKKCMFTKDDFTDQDNWKLVEQNPVDKVEPDILIEESHQQQTDDLIDMVTEKPAWSEDDEKNIDFLIHLIEHNVPNHSFAFGDGCAYGCKSKEEAINMLKDLKDRVQPKQEWSDVDKDILFRTIDNLKFLRNTISIDPKYAVNIIDIERGITWLKSLRPQNTWKPSDEQMLAISTAINVVGKGTINGKYLIELQEQLKKLREK